MVYQTLRVAAARVALEMATALDLIDAAHAALDRGVYTFSLGELATARGASLAECSALLAAALRELGLEKPTPAAAVPILLDHALLGMAEGTLSSGAGLDELREMDRNQKETLPDGALDSVRSFIGMCYELDEWPYYYNLSLPGAETTTLEEAREAILNGATVEAARWCHDRWGPALDPSWLTPTVVALVRGIAADRALDRLPILADALEEAGCDDRDMLEHLRGDRPHPGDCFFVNLMLDHQADGRG